MLGGKPQLEHVYSLGVEPEEIPDPGDGGTIDVSRSGYCRLSSGGGGETRTLPDPTFIGQVIDFIFVVDGSDVVITSSSPVNQTGNTSLTFADVGDHLRLFGAHNATDGWEWKVVCNDGIALA